MIYFIHHTGIQEGIGGFDNILPFNSKSAALKKYKELKLEWCDSEDTTDMTLYQAELQPLTKKALMFACLSREGWYKEDSKVELENFQSGLSGHCEVRGCPHCKRRKALEKLGAAPSKKRKAPPPPETWGSWRTIE